MRRSGVPIGGPIHELWPETCPAGHRCGPPVDGVTLNLTGWLPCHCTGAGDRGGHRSHTCLAPDCPDPVTLIPPCSGATNERAIHTR